LSSSRSTPATYVDRYGVLKTVGPDVIRMNEKGVLIEGASTNLLTFSIPNSSWTSRRSSITENTVSSPVTGGLVTSSTVASTVIGVSYIYQNHSYTSGVSYTASAIVKAGVGSSICRLRLHTDAFDGNKTIEFNLSTGQIIDGSDASATVEVLTDGWYRISVSGVADATVSTFGPLIYFGDQSVGQSIHVYGVQLEALPFASSYIPTAGSPVTRAADSIYIEPIGNLPELNIIKGFTVSAEVNALHEGGDLILNKYIWGLYPNSNEHLIMKLSPGNFLTVGSRSDATMYQASVDTINQTGMAQKLVGVYESSGAVKAYVDYVETQGGQNLTGKWMDWNFTGGYKIAIGGYNTSQNLKLWGYIKNFRFFDQALTADQVKLL